MTYLEFRFEVPPSMEAETMVGLLSQMPFEAYQEAGEEVIAYLQSTDDQPAFRTALAEMTATFEWTYTEQVIPDQNWNAIWESNFQPIQVGHFVRVKAEFHPSDPAVRHEIIIQPRMAFGTGHHPTTYLMMEAMGELDFTGKRVLDYGCGTGILAILAAQIGASPVVGVDNEEAAYENSLANARRNGVAWIDFYLGTLQDVPTGPYDMVLANINRNVIQQSMPSLHQYTQPGGYVLVSGILRQDADQIENDARAAFFSPIQRAARGEWVFILLERQ